MPEPKFEISKQNIRNKDKLRKIVDSGSDSDSDYETISESHETTEDSSSSNNVSSEDDDIESIKYKDKKLRNISKEEFQQALSKLYPSKYMKDKVKPCKKKEKSRKEELYDSDITGDDDVSIKKYKKDKKLCYLKE